MRLLPILMILLMMGGIFGLDFVSCKGTNHAEDKTESLADANQVESEETASEEAEAAYEEDNDTTEVYEYVSPVIPSFIKDRFGDAYWWADTICVVGNKAFLLANSEYWKPSVIYNEDRIITYAPMLTIDSFGSGCKYKFYVSIVGKTMLVDFSDASSLRALSSLSKELPSFKNYSFDSTADYNERVSYYITVDFPKSSISHANEIGRWLVDKIAASQHLNEAVPPLNAMLIGYTKRSKGGWKYKGDINDHRKITQCAASVYFALMKSEWGTIEEDYPSCLYSVLNLHARVFNNRFVTYQQFTYEYDGGVHGYFTERLISFDHVHKQEIDYNYLFKPESEKELLDILLEEAKKNYKYWEWDPQITKSIVITNENGKPTGDYSFPRPGLSDEGIVFSFLPYEISCFAAGTFHFTIPYKSVQHLLTPRGKWCVGLDK